MQTIDEHCGVPEGTFKKFIKKQQNELLKIEKERKSRIRKKALDKP
jgi:hypothetical protein